MENNTNKRIKTLLTNTGDLALRRRAKNLRELAERGMCPRKYKKEAERLEEIANERESK